MQTPVDYDGFAAHLALTDRRSTTIRKHLNALHYLERNGVVLEINEITHLFIRLKQEHKSASYLNGFIDAIRLYAKYANLSEDLKSLKGYKEHPSIKATLSDDEIDAFLGLRRRFHEPFDHYKMFTMFWSIIADTGCRPGEVAKLKKSDIDWGRGVIIIRVTKTNTPGVVPIPPNHADLLKDYLEDLPTDYLFPSARGGKHYSMDGEAVIDNVDWHHDWKCRLKVLGLTRPHLTPYSFRHSYATRLLEEDISLFHVKKLMRHNDLKSTLVYEHLTTKDLIKAQSKLPRIQRNTNPLQVLQRWGEKIKEFHVEQDDRFEYEYSEDGNSLTFKISLRR
jgi:integrase/recombinase XerD